MTSKSDIIAKRLADASDDGVLITYSLLDKVSKVTRFLRWAKETHNIVNTRDLVNGYKHLATSILRLMINEISYSRRFLLTNDEIHNRARFVGFEKASLSGLPNSCDKTTLERRILRCYRAVSKERTWKGLENSLRETLKELRAFKTILDSSLSVKASANKEYIISALEAYYVFNYLNNTEKGFPHSELYPTTVPMRISPEYLERAFEGYVYGLQFLWLKVLGNDRFKEACTKEIHRVLEPDYIPIYERDPSIIEPLNIDEEKRSNPTKVKWKKIDSFYRRIQTEIIDPAESKLKTSFGRKGLLRMENYSKKLIKNLLDSNKAPIASYLTGNDWSSIKKQLDLETLWFQIQAQDPGNFFNEVPLFGYTLIGYSEFSSIYNLRTPIRVLLIKHPEGLGRYRYSFGILIRQTSTLSDFSGWIFFLGCATDYSGLGGSLLIQAQIFMDIANRIYKVNVKELIIDEETLIRYLRERIVSSSLGNVVLPRKLGNDERINFPDFLSQVKGLVFNGAVYKWLSERDRNVRYSSNLVVEREEIDILGQGKEKIELYECKMSVDYGDSEKYIAQIKRKARVLEHENKEFTTCLVVYDPVDFNTRHIFETNKILVLHDFRRLIKMEKNFKDSAALIMRILETGRTIHRN